MGLLGDAFGSGANGASIPSFSGGSAKDLFSLSILFPELGQFIEASLAQGQNINDALAPFILKGKEGKQAFKANPQSVVKGGNGIYYDIAGIGTALPKKLDSSAQYKLDQTQSFYNKLKNVPALSSLVAKADGNFDDEYLQNFNNTFGKLASGSLGAAASQGFLTDQNKLNATLAPISAAGAQYKLETQTGAENELKALAGFGSIPGYSPAGLSGPSSAGALNASFGNGANLWLQGQMANQGADIAAQKLKMLGAQWGIDFIGDTAAGAATGGGWG